MLDWLKKPLNRVASWLAKVTAVDVGKPDDGLVPMPAGTDQDKDWHTLRQEFQDALEAWRKNPIARRLVSIVTAYVVGSDGIRLRTQYQSLARYVTQFFNQRDNRIMLRQQDWSDELSRSGELFLVLFHNPANGMATVRAVPASRIEKVDWRTGDYETETYFHEVPDEPGGEGKVWYSPNAPEADEVQRDEDGAVISIPPVMLHYAVNRPVGAVRGESDLAPILPWLKRYSRWLEDRVRLNRAVRAFLWIVKVPERLLKSKKEQYRSPPPAGSVIVADKENEEWEAVTPKLEAKDAASDGRAIRWMLVAGGPGIGLHDIGEAETANLATAEAMAEQRRRFLRRRQTYFSYVIEDLTLHAWNRAVRFGLTRGREVDGTEVEVETPEIAPADNRDLAGAAKEIAAAMQELEDILGPSEALRRFILRVVLKFAGESVSEDAFEEIVTADRPTDDESDIEE